jgi:hypothetical protein
MSATFCCSNSKEFTYLWYILSLTSPGKEAYFG